MSQQDQQPSAESQLPPELLLLLDAFRKEFEAKIGSLKLWGGLLLLGGGTLGGVISRFIDPAPTTTTVRFVVSIFT